MAGLSEKVHLCVHSSLSEQDAKDAENCTTVTGSTTREEGVASFSVVETPGVRQPTPLLDPSEATLSLAQNISVLRFCAWFREGPDGEALLFGDGGQNKGARPSLLIFFVTCRLPSPVCGCHLGNCRLRLLALPAIIHQYLTSASSNHRVFDIV